MNTVWHRRNDAACTHCVFCGVAKKQLMAPVVPAGLVEVTAWPARYVFPSCTACQEAALVQGQVLAAAAGALAEAASTVHLGTRVQDAARALASRLAQAMFYDQHGRIFPDFGAIYFYWEPAGASPIPGFSVEDLLAAHGEPDTLRSGDPALDRQFVLDLAASTCAVTLEARVADAFRLLVFADMSPDTLAANTHELYDLLPGGLNQAQAGVYH